MKVKLNDIELFYKKSGSGRPLIMLHGNGETHQIFDKLAISLAAHYTVYQIDSRNHGQSSLTTEYHYETMATDIFRFILQLELQNVSILGFSDGAIISVLLNRYPELSIAKLAILGINLSPKDFKQDVYAEILAEYKEKPTPLTKIMLDEPQISLSEIAKIQSPTLVVAGEDDVCLPDFYYVLTQTLPQGNLLILPGHTHSSYIVDSNILAAPLLAFLTK